MNTLPTLIAACTAFLFIAIGAWVTQPVAAPATLRIEQIKTDGTHTYPYQASTGRMTFVEQVE